RLTAADDGYRLRVGHRPGNRARPVAERLVLELADRAVPDDRRRLGDRVRIDGPRLWADVETFEPVRDAAFGDLRFRSRVRLVRDDEIDWQRDLALTEIQQLLGNVELILLDPRRPRRLAERGHERVTHRAADQQSIDPLQQRLQETDL